MPTFQDEGRCGIAFDKGGISLGIQLAGIRMSLGSVCKPACVTVSCAIFKHTCCRQSYRAPSFRDDVVSETID